MSFINIFFQKFSLLHLIFLDFFYSGDFSSSANIFGVVLFRSFLFFSSVSVLEFSLLRQMFLRFSVHKFSLLQQMFLEFFCSCNFSSLRVFSSSTSVFGVFHGIAFKIKSLYSCAACLLAVCLFKSLSFTSS